MDISTPPTGGPTTEYWNGTAVYLLDTSQLLSHSSNTYPPLHGALSLGTPTGLADGGWILGYSRWGTCETYSTERLAICLGILGLPDGGALAPSRALRHPPSCRSPFTGSWPRRSRLRALLDHKKETLPQDVLRRLWMISFDGDSTVQVVRRVGSYRVSKPRETTEAEHSFEDW
jgi:hypothetical protein